jgi:hypothetical protein
LGEVAGFFFRDDDFGNVGVDERRGILLIDPA